MIPDYILRLFLLIPGQGSEEQETERRARRDISYLHSALFTCSDIRYIYLYIYIYICYTERKRYPASGPVHTEANFLPSFLANFRTEFRSEIIAGHPSEFLHGISLGKNRRKSERISGRNFALKKSQEKIATSQLVKTVWTFVWNFRIRFFFLYFSQRNPIPPPGVGGP